MPFYITEKTLPLFLTWEILPQSPQNHSFLQENKETCLSVYKELFLHVENENTFWKKVIIHHNLHLFNKFNLRGKNCLKFFFFPPSFSRGFLLKVRWIPKCYPLFFFWYLCVPWDSTYPTLKLRCLLFLCCLYPLLVQLAFDSFQLTFSFSSLAV